MHMSKSTVTSASILAINNKYNNHHHLIYLHKHHIYIYIYMDTCYLYARVYVVDVEISNYAILCLSRRKKYCLYIHFVCLIKFESINIQKPIYEKNIKINLNLLLIVTI